MKNCIYMLTNLINGKKYVGQARDSDKRLSRHLRAVSSGSGSYIHRAIRKHGWDNFSYEILESNLLAGEMNDRERYWINKHKSFSHGYNLTTGGEKAPGYIVSKETREKMSKSRKGKTMSEESKIKIGNAHRGKTISKEQREKISQAHRSETKLKQKRDRMIGNTFGVGNKSNLGRKLPKEQRVKISQAIAGKNNPFFGKKHTDEMKVKMSDMKKGDKHPMYGKKQSAETCLKKSEALKKAHREDRHKGKGTLGYKHTDATKRKISIKRAVARAERDFEYQKNNPFQKELILDRSL